MRAETYELLAYAARYWFVILALLIAFRGWRACVQDNRKARLLRSWAGGTGCVGELILLEDGSKRRPKKPVRYMVPAEAVLGSGRAADIRIHNRDIRKRHIFMTWRPGEMVLHPAKNAEVSARRLPDGTLVLREGDMLTIGSVKLGMLFFNAEDAARMAPDSGQRKKPAQILPEDASKDEFEDVWE